MPTRNRRRSRSRSESHRAAPERARLSRRSPVAGNVNNGSGGSRRMASPIRPPPGGFRVSSVSRRRSMRRRITIANKTHWQTKQLRAFVVRIAQDIFGDDKRPLHVTFKYNRQVRGCVTGWAYYQSGASRIMVPSQAVDKIDLAHTIAHKFGHNKGLRHRDM